MVKERRTKRNKVEFNLKRVAGHAKPVARGDDAVVRDATSELRQGKRRGSGGETGASREKFIIRAVRPRGRKSKTQWFEEIRELSGHLLEHELKGGETIVFYVTAVGDKRFGKDYIGHTICGQTDRIEAAGANLEFVDLGFARTYMNQFEAIMTLEDESPGSDRTFRAPGSGDLGCYEPQPLLEEDDVAEDQSGVPINNKQFESIRRIGVDRTVLIQGPPGTGKSTTIFNGIAHRLPDNKQALVCAITNQAVSAVLEKFMTADSYVPLKDDNQPLRGQGTGKFSFVLCGRVAEKLPEAKEYHIDTIAGRLADARPEMVKLKVQREAFAKAVENRVALDNCYARSGYRLEKRMKFFRLHGWQVKDKTFFWVRAFEKHIHGHEKPNYQAFADEVLTRRIADGNHDDGRIKFAWVGDECRTFKDVQRLSMEHWNRVYDSERERHIQELKIHILLNSDIVFCTVDTLHRKIFRVLREADRVHSIFIDEASLVPEEAMPVIALLKATTVVMVGDQKQLRPFTNTELNLVAGEDRTLARSFFERCVDNGVRYTMLEHNFRNPEKLVDIMNHMTYDGLLYPAAEGRNDPDPVRWVNHQHNEDLKSDGDPSSRNRGEADVVLKLYRKLKREGVGSIKVITFYKGQYGELHSKLGRDGLRDGDSINTVDSCQGTEADCVIISCARSNGAGRVGFTGHPNRLNVAISRARQRLYFVGNKATFTSRGKHGLPKSAIWSKLIGKIDELERR